MELEEYVEKSKRTINSSLLRNERINHAIYGMISELGEVASFYQKKYQNHPFTKETKERITSELGDLCWFAAEWSNTMKCVVHRNKENRAISTSEKAHLIAIHGAINRVINTDIRDLRYEQKAVINKLFQEIEEFCWAADIEFEEVLDHNYQKLLKRYPDGFDAERSLHRAEGDL